MDMVGTCVSHARVCGNMVIWWAECRLQSVGAIAAHARTSLVQHEHGIGLDGRAKSAPIQDHRPYASIQARNTHLALLLHAHTAAALLEPRMN